MILLTWLLLCSTAFLVQGAADWSYTSPANNPHNWQNHFPVCKGASQSPIDISHSDSTYSETLPTVQLTLNHNAALSRLTYTVENNGHTVTIIFPPDTWYVTLTEDRTKLFEVVQLHSHWGSTNDRGSEHTFDGKPVSMEAHLVCFNKRLYKDSSQAKSSPSGLAVFAFMSQESERATTPDTLIGNLGDMSAALTRVLQPGQTTTIPAFDLRNILKLVTPDEFYRYSGSLTTPPCTQNVEWTVFRKVIPITNSQLKSLRAIQFGPSETEKQMKDNFRPIMPLNSKITVVPRVVYRSWNSSFRVAISIPLLMLSLLFYLSD